MMVATALMCSVPSLAVTEPAAQVGTDVSGFSSTLLDGSEIDGSVFSDYTVSVVTYWATWSGPCQLEMPFFQQAYEEVEGVGVFGLLHEDGTSTVSAAVELMEDSGCTYPCFVTDSVWSAVTEQAGCIPQTFFVDENGVILEARHGYFTSYDALYERLVYWLGQIAPQTFTVRFRDGLTGQTLLTVTDVPFGGSVTPPTPLEHEGYIFSGWSTDEYNNVTSDLIVTAQYVRCQYRVRFICSLDNVVIWTQQVYHGEAAIAPAPHEHSGYEFVGWSESFDCVTDNLYIYALYDEVVPEPDGDVDCNGIVNNLDALLALRISCGLEECTDECVSHGDMNGNGTIDVTDALLILRVALGLA